MTISLSIDFSRATASAIWSSSSRLAEMPVRLMGLSLLLGRLLLLFQAGGAHRGPPLQQVVVQHQLGLENPAERDHRGLRLAFQVEADLVALHAGHHAADPLAALRQAVQLHLDLLALLGREALGPGQR